MSYKHKEILETYDLICYLFIATLVNIYAVAVFVATSYTIAFMCAIGIIFIIQMHGRNQIKKSQLENNG